MYCEKCDRTEYDQIALEMGTCSRCYSPLHAPDDDDDWSYFPKNEESQAKATEDNAALQGHLEATGGPGVASRLSTGSGTGAPFPKKMPEPDSPLRKLFPYPDEPVQHISPTETTSAYEPIVGPPTGTAETALATWRRVAKKWEKRAEVAEKRAGELETEIKRLQGIIEYALRNARDFEAVYETAQKPSATMEDALFANCKPGEGFDGPQGAE